jgi:hypothetical protein
MATTSQHVAVRALLQRAQHGPADAAVAIDRERSTLRGVPAPRIPRRDVVDGEAELLEQQAAAGADSPKLSMPTMRPSRPTYLYQ